MAQPFTLSNTKKYAVGILRSLKTPFSSGLCKALERGDYASIATASLDPSDYKDGGLFKRDYLALNLLRKYDDLPLGIDVQAKAIESFLDSEQNCRTINHYFGRNPFVRDSGSLDQSFEAVFWTAKEKIAKLLGKFDWDECAGQFGFSSGASTRLPRRTGSPFYKYQGKPETTRDCALLAICAIWERPLWRDQMQTLYGLDPCQWVTIVEGSRTTTVPKSSTTDRTICVEPDMNMFIQRGIGSVIRRRLKRVSIDLDDQCLNQRLACIGSRTGSLATIDLKSASDSIALSLVEALVPADWFSAMCRCRSAYTILPNGVKHRLEKISSMGNGFTFELESLIFWALTSSVVQLSGVEDSRIGIYGDDIICHASVSERLVEVLEYAGFLTNVDKTFIRGPFRESCGKHYFLGSDVTPFYIKSACETLDRKFWLINSIRLWSGSDRMYSDNSIMKMARYVRDQIPLRHRYYVPESFGLTSGIISHWDEAVPRYCKRRQQFSIRVYRPSRQRHRPNGPAALLHWFDVNRKTSDDLLWLEKGNVKYSHKNAYLAWWDETAVSHWDFIRT